MKLKKQAKSELEIVRQYANGIIHRQITRGHSDRIIKTDRTTNKDLWMDTDFFFSVVFQSAKQKDAFLREFCKKFQIEVDHANRIQVVNGIRLAENVGIKLEKEKMESTPVGSLDLRPYVLDNETL